jgi:Anti-sigma-K factor rskA
MLSERDIEAAHPEAFDFVWGNLPVAKRAEFDRHLSGCSYCQGVVHEYSEIGQIIKLLPPHVEAPAGLEDRTVAGMTAAVAEQRAARPARLSDAEDEAATRVYPIPERQSSAEPETLVRPIPRLGPQAEEQAKGPPASQPAQAATAARPVITRLPVWRRHRGLFAAIAAAAAAIVVAAIVVPFSLGRSPAGVAVAIPLHATAAAKIFGVGAASGQATARQVGESWTFDLTVHGLKPLPGNDVYVCWWAAPGSTKAHPALVTGGSFVVGDSGSAVLTMTTGVDPRQFRIMEITAEPPGDGALHGPVLLTGQTA